MSERRHRIDNAEIPVVIEAMADYLNKRCAAKDNLDSATLAFMVWWRLVRDKTGHPGYPSPIDWQAIEGSLINGTVLPPLRRIECPAHASEEDEAT